MMKKLKAVRVANLPYSPDSQNFRIGEARMPIAAVIAGLRGADADPAVLADLQAQISAIYDAGGGNAALQNATYTDGVLAYTGGAINGYPAMTMTFPLSVAAGGVLTMPSISGGVLYVAVISGHALPPSMPALAIVVGSGSIGIYDTTYAVAPGTTVPLQWTDHSISAQIDGEWRTLSDTPVADPHVLLFEISGGEVAPVAIAVDGLMVGVGPGGLLLQEIEDRQAADAALSGQMASKASQAALDALAGTVADVQTLAQVNQLNITTKADQLDLDALQTTVTGQGITLAQKADQTALDALGTVVSGKATPADITSAIATLVDGAPAALDTLSEIATALAGEQAQISDLLAALALRVRVDAVQSLTLAQQLQARQNINAEQAGVAAGLVAAITPASIGAATAVQGAKADAALQSTDLAPVAFSGAYSALTGLPTIPGLSSSTPAAPTTGGTAGTDATAARGDHAHPLPTSAQITAAVLTGLATGSAVAIAAADTLLQALAKLQAQASANAAGVAANAELLAPVPRKIGPSWFVSGRWYDPCHPFFLYSTTATVPAGAVQFVPMCPVDTLTAQQIGIYISTASAAGSKIRLGIYADSAGTPGARLYDSGDIASDSTGNKTAACTQAFTAGVRYWLALYSGASVVVYALLGTAMGQVALTGSSTAYAMSGQSGLPTSATGAIFSSIHNPRIMLQAG